MEPATSVYSNAATHHQYLLADSYISGYTVATFKKCASYTWGGANFKPREAFFYPQGQFFYPDTCTYKI